jgi:hypothetical protein
MKNYLNERYPNKMTSKIGDYKFDLSPRFFIVEKRKNYFDEIMKDKEKIEKFEKIENLLKSESL